MNLRVRDDRRASIIGKRFVVALACVPMEWAFGTRSAKIPGCFRDPVEDTLFRISGFAAQPGVRSPTLQVAVIIAFMLRKCVPVLF
jgi:hypothetical protein